MAARDPPVKRLGSARNSQVDGAQAGLADGPQESVAEEVSNERMRADDMPRVRSAFAKEAMTFAVLDQCSSRGYIDVSCDWTEGQVDSVEDRGPHQELL